MDHLVFAHSPAGIVHRVPGGNYRAFIPNPLPPAIVWTTGLVTELADAERAIGALGAIGGLLPNPQLLITPFLRREAVLSSQIEGTRASLSDLYVYEAQQLALFEGPSDVREVYNYVDALEYGLARLTSLPVSLRLICEMHGRLMAGVRGGQQAPGAFRSTQNWIGPANCALNEATYVPPPPSEMRDALSALEVYVHSGTALPALLRLGLIHYQFEAIHPFVDGNGRMGRLLITLLLCAWQLLPQPLLYLSAYFEAHRQRYYDLLLAVSQHGDWETWLRFFLQGVSQQATDARLRAQRLQELRERWRARLQETRASARALHVVDLVFARPVISVSQVAKALDVQPVQASRYVQVLVDEGMLREITGRSRNRLYQAHDVMSVLNMERP